MSRIAVAMSGGVDSSVAAGLLVRQGHEVVGLTLQLWDVSEENMAASASRCCSPADIADARAVAARLNIPHYVFDHGELFRRKIVEPFLDAYVAGQTPSPCIQCNRQIKFGSLLQLARSLGAQRLATGHYARLDSAAGRPRIRTGLDANKDQSYFLFGVEAIALQSIDLPLGSLTKQQVRQLAHEMDLPVADKSESYELCFIPDGDKDSFVRRHRPYVDGQEGRFVDPDGHDLGRSGGSYRYTVGQRRALGLPGIQRRYVLEVRTREQQVVVGPEAALYRRVLWASHCNWIGIEPPRESISACARIRHRHAPAPARLQPVNDGLLRVVFNEPQRAIAPGQGIAFYDGDLLLGGGWISSDRPE